ncbi:hypothetical protein VFPPC_15458 [Pochonia chlamydosporia 170]|uniref:Uncharacterized protein n=1 Tax=Pochonia chlamydosporia 170 TaxID=1380566 RepID=A0A179FVI1_METCM|nr:hypothetical protein VFPPC_15458 [Pochonia chlamydosporia 170]OAQ69622.1 hypothetical protein VFPPC_15458 [Pochonia chlamydosporia 170]
MQSPLPKIKKERKRKAKSPQVAIQPACPSLPRPCVPGIQCLVQMFKCSNVGCGVWSAKGTLNQSRPDIKLGNSRIPATIRDSMTLAIVFNRLLACQAIKWAKLHVLHIYAKLRIKSSRPSTLHKSGLTLRL